MDRQFERRGASMIWDWYLKQSFWSGRLCYQATAGIDAVQEAFSVRAHSIRYQVELVANS